MSRTTSLTLLYQAQLESSLELENLGFGNEADAELESDEDCPWELDLSVVGLDNPIFDDIAFDPRLVS